MIGVSCHTIDELRAAENEGADFAVYGPVFPSVTKIARCPSVSRLFGKPPPASACPVYALGGVTPQNAPQCIEAGAAGVAGISLYSRNTTREGLLPSTASLPPPNSARNFWGSILRVGRLRTDRHSWLLFIFPCIILSSARRFWSSRRSARSPRPPSPIRSRSASTSADNLADIGLGWTPASRRIWRSGCWEASARPYRRSGSAYGIPRGRSGARPERAPALAIPAVRLHPAAVRRRRRRNAVSRLRISGSGERHWPLRHHTSRGGALRSGPFAKFEFRAGSRSSTPSCGAWCWATPTFAAATSGCPSACTSAGTCLAHAGRESQRVYNGYNRVRDALENQGPLSGGAYGPEGGLLTTVVAIGLFFYLAKAPIQHQEASRLPEEP